jgi:hypothetical protein
MIQVILGFLFLLFVGQAVILNANVKSECLAAGYPNHEIDWSLNAYCIKRVNQTDVVVPFADRKSVTKTIDAGRPVE